MVKIGLRALPEWLVKAASLALQPVVGGMDIALEQAFQVSMESRGVIEMGKVCHFMCHDRAADKIGGHNQPPGYASTAARRPL